MMKKIDDSKFAMLGQGGLKVREYTAQQFKILTRMD